jgi:hypothetical protein
MHVVDSGTSIMGDHDMDGEPAGSLQPGAPVRITGLCVMGGVEVKHKAREPASSRGTISG